MTSTRGGRDADFGPRADDSAECLLVVGGYRQNADTLGAVVDEAKKRILMSPALGDFFELRWVDMGMRPVRSADEGADVARLVLELTSRPGEAARNFSALLVIDQSAAAVDRVLRTCRADRVLFALKVRFHGLASKDDPPADQNQDAGPEVEIAPRGKRTFDELIEEVVRYAENLLSDFGSGGEPGVPVEQLDELGAVAESQLGGVVRAAVKADEEARREVRRTEQREEAERREAEHREAERREAERRKAERREAERREAEWRQELERLQEVEHQRLADIQKRAQKDAKSKKEAEPVSGEAAPRTEPRTEADSRRELELREKEAELRAREAALEVRYKELEAQYGQALQKAGGDHQETEANRETDVGQDTSAERESNIADETATEREAQEPDAQPNAKVLAGSSRGELPADATKASQAAAEDPGPVGDAPSAANDGQQPSDQPDSEPRKAGRLLADVGKTGANLLLSRVRSRPTAPDGDGMRTGDGVPLLAQCVARLREGDLKGFKSSISRLRAYADAGISTQERQRCRGFIIHYQLFAPNMLLYSLDVQFYDALLRLAYGLPLSYPAYCDVEDLVAAITGKVGGPPHRPLLEAISEGRSEDVRVTALTRYCLGQDRLADWFRSGQVNVRRLISALAGDWDRPLHADVLFDITLRYLERLQGSYNQQVLRSALGAHGYLAAAVRERYPQSVRDQVTVLLAFLRTAYPAGLDRRAIAEVFTVSEPTRALAKAVLRALANQGDRFWAVRMFARQLGTEELDRAQEIELVKVLMSAEQD